MTIHTIRFIGKAWWILAPTAPLGPYETRYAAECAALELMREQSARYVTLTPTGPVYRDKP